MGRGLARLKFILLGLAIVGYAQTGGRYLIITPDAFYGNLQPLVDWKYRKGLSPVVYRLSQIGSDSISIRNFIYSCYLNWDIKPQYVVLVGHGGYIPMCYYNYGGYSYYTDNYYANMDGDIYNEILPGRLSVADATQLNVLIAKIMAYERTPDMSDSSWFIRGVAMANCDGEDDSIYLSCMRYAESLAVNSGFSSVDTFVNYYGHNVGHLMNSINSGRSFVLYRGNANNQWYDPFNIYPPNLSNGRKLPVIISTTCRTVSPNASPILCENFIRTGTTSVLKGAVAFFGGTRNTGNASHLRNAVAKGFLDAMFSNNKITFGEIGEQGRLRVYQMYGELREYNNFTCIGDPDMNIWTDVPCSLIVNYPPILGPHPQVINVLVQNGATAAPIPNATVCLAGKLDSLLYFVDTTDASGSVSFNIDPNYIGDTVWVTVTGKNLRPHEGYMPVNPIDYAFILYHRSEIRDIAVGNGDGIINPGEDIEMPVWIYNLSESTGINIQGKINSNNNCIIINDSIRSFGDVLGLDSAVTIPNGFRFTVTRNCPNMHLIDFQMFLTDHNDSTWQSAFYHVVKSPVIGLDGRIISGGNGNGVFEPGETVNLTVILRNYGDASAESLNMILRTSTSGISVIDSVGYIGRIGIDSTGDNSSNLFTINADSAVSFGTAANFEVIIASRHQDDTVSLTLIVGQKSFYLWNADPTPTPGQNSYNILTGLGYTGDQGTTLPADLSLYRVLFCCLGVYPNRYLIGNNSIEALAITNFLNSGGRVCLESSSAFYIDVFYFSGHNFGPLFKIAANVYSYGDLGPLNGQAGTFTNGMNFNYGGENAYMDHLNPSGGFAIFRDANNGYYCGVAGSTSTYRTVGLSFELGLLADASPPSTRAALLDSIMRFFGVPLVGIAEQENKLCQNGSLSLQVLPNPFLSKTVIRLQMTDGGKGIDKKIDIDIYDISGRLVKSYILPTAYGLLPTELIWDGRDDQNRRVGAGIYFIRILADGLEKTEKVVKLK